MLSIGTIKASPGVAARYYTQGDYYEKDGSEPTEWGGCGAAALGLIGSVDAGTFKALLAGSLPEGHSIGWKRSGKDHRPGYDLTFSAPKGVSIMATVGGDTRLIEAHHNAVKEALKFAETYAHVRQRLSDGSYKIKLTGSLIIAQFTEFFSRALDPHLHTHSVVANATNDKDRDAWYALHGDAFYTMGMAIGQVYRNALAPDVKALGYQIRAEKDTGLFDIKNVPQVLLEVYSQRRKAIEEYAKENDWKSAADFARATLLTRPNKAKANHEHVIDDLKERAGDQLRVLEALKLEAHQNGKPFIVDHQHVRGAAVHSVRHLAAREAVFEYGNLIKEALKASIGETRVGDIEAVLKDLKGREKIQETSFQTGGKYIFHGRTINQSLAWEAKVAEAIIKHRDQVWPLASKQTIERSLRASQLTDEQKDAVRSILRSRDRAVAVIGVAGSGKSHLIKTLKTATPSRQYLALAPTATAAIDLGKSAGIEGKTLQKFLETGGREAGRNSVLIVDEASMASTRQALRLLSIAEARRARVILVGDTKQFDAIDQGKPLALLMEQGLRGPFIGTSFRQKNASMQQIVKAARDGKVGTVLNMLGDRLKQIETSDLAPEIAQAWAKNERRNDIQIAALDNSSRIAINSEIRRHLQKEGKVGKEDHAFHILSSKALTHAQMRIADYYKKDNILVFHMGQKALEVARDSMLRVVKSDGRDVTLKDEHTGEKLKLDPSKTNLRGATLYDVQDRKLSKGDRIQWRKNLRDTNIQNGHTGTIKRIDGNSAEIKFDHGVKRAVDLKEHPYWDHGYALTVYKQQGKTTPVNWVVANTSRSGEVTQKLLYVSLTRAERSVQLFTDDRARFENVVKNNPGGKTSSLEGRGALADLKASVFDRPQSFTERLLDRLPDQLRTLSANIVDIARERGLKGHTSEAQVSKHADLTKVTAITEAVEQRPDTTLQKDDGRDTGRDR